MDYFSVFLLVIGLLSIVIGYLRKYKGLLIIPFNREDKDDIYIKKRGLYDIYYGASIILGGIWNEIYSPDRTIFLIILSLVTIIETIVFYVYIRKG